MDCHQKQVLEERRKAATDEFGDLVTQLSGGRMAGSLYDTLTTKKDQAWERVRSAERALDDHKREHGC